MNVAASRTVTEAKKEKNATLRDLSVLELQQLVGRCISFTNAMFNIDGRPLQHFTPFWTPDTAGVNVFAQNISQKENCYAFPPFNLLVPLISLINECQIVCTVVVPAYEITPACVPLIAGMMQDALVLGLKGQKGILRYPSKYDYVPDKYGLPWNLWALLLSDKAKTDYVW